MIIKICTEYSAVYLHLEFEYCLSKFAYLKLDKVHMLEASTAYSIWMS